jgi:hypothetical protein
LRSYCLQYACSVVDWNISFENTKCKFKYKNKTFNKPTLKIHLTVVTWSHKKVSDLESKLKPSKMEYNLNHVWRIRWWYQASGASRRPVTST